MSQPGPAPVTSPRSTGRFRWRPVDIVVASVVAVAIGVVFFFWAPAYNGLSGPAGALLPGVQSFVEAPWLVGGVLGGLLIRKPGAALYVELLAALVSALLGSSFGMTAVQSGLVQGLAAELVFAVFLYRVHRLPIAVLAGAVSGVAMGVNELILYYSGSSAGFATAYVVAAAVGGAIVAGPLSWLAVRALARTGALHRFAAGRDERVLV